MKTLLILGAGTAGTMVANKMSEHLKHEDWKIHTTPACYSAGGERKLTALLYRRHITRRRYNIIKFKFTPFIYQL